MEKKQSLVMFPYMSQGHIIPLLVLALKIEQTRRYNIVFVNTPLNIRKLRRSLPATSSIRLLEIPFDSSDHGLPPHAENTDALPRSLHLRLLQASTTLKPAFKSLLADLISSGSPPLCVVANFFFGWSAEVARELGIFHAFFSGTSAFSLACSCSMWRNLPHRSTSSPVFTLPDFPEAGEFSVTQLPAHLLQADGDDPWSVFHNRNIRDWSNTDAFLFNSVGELEEIGSEYFRRRLNRPIWCVGPLLRLRAETQTHRCLEWLNSKPPNSVLYISFGSMHTIAASQMKQLAEALDKIKVNFIWVVRPPLEFDIAAEFRAEEWLPEGFMKRVAEDEPRGLIVTEWAPQVEILAHESVGCFLTHCGWNSAMEALRGGVPLMGWPLWADHFFNAKLLAEIGVAVEVARGTSCEIRCEDVVEKIEMVMMTKESNEKGKDMRRRAGELKEMINGAIKDGSEEGLKGSSVKAIDEFLEAALSFNEKKIKKLGSEKY